MNTLKELREAALKLGKFASADYVEVVKDTDTVFWFRIYTDNNSYSISARVRDDGSAYLGCIASSRKPRAGETWTRGNDLADGDLSYETWVNILRDIISYETVKVHRASNAMRDAELPTV